MATPIVKVAKGGVAVTEAANKLGMPVTVAANGRGLAVTVVAKGGLPVVGSGGGVPGLPPYLGHVATNTGQCNATDSNNKQQMVRRRHCARVALTGLRLVLPNFYINQTTHKETALGAAASCTASVEYPAGVFTQVLFSGSSTGTIPNGGHLVSDLTPISIPEGAYFYTRWWRNSSAGIVFASTSSPGSVVDTANGEAMAFGVTSADLTMGGTVTSGGNYMAPPLAVLGITTKESVVMFGDSRADGVFDFYSAAGAQQTLRAYSRGFGQIFGHSVYATSGNTLVDWLTGNTNQVAMAGYATRIINELMINDLINGRSPAQIIADIQTMRALFPGKPFYVTTMSPWASSTDSWATLANQTSAFFNANRVSLNTSIRAGIATVTGNFDIAGVSESSLNSGKWTVTGAANYMAQNDGHESNSGYIAIAAGLNWETKLKATP